MPILSAVFLMSSDRAPWRVPLAAATIATISIVVGCGSTSDRLPVSGIVTLDGVPLAEGSIRFDSSGGQKVIATGSLIKDGEYYVSQEKGLPPGKYRVQITSPDENAPPLMMPATASGPGFRVPPDRIPPEYNVKSNVTVEVTADGDNEFEFAVASAGKK
jgi:hypothetical protein